MKKTHVKTNKFFATLRIQNPSHLSWNITYAYKLDSKNFFSSVSKPDTLRIDLIHVFFMVFLFLVFFSIPKPTIKIRVILPRTVLTNVLILSLCAHVFAQIHVCMYSYYNMSRVHFKFKTHSLGCLCIAAMDLSIWLFCKLR